MTAIVCVAGLSGDVGAQIPLADSWRWVEFDSDDGLPNGHVVRVVEDRNATVWALTEDGDVAWFDDFWWRPVASDGGVPGRVDELESNGTSGVYLLTAGQVYQGDALGFSAVVGAPSGSSDISALGNDEVVVLNSGRLFRLRDGQASEMKGPPEGGAVTAISDSPPGELWVTAGGASYRWNGVDGWAGVQAMQNAFVEKSPVESRVVQSVVRNGDDAYSILSRDKPLEVWKLEDQVPALDRVQGGDPEVTAVASRRGSDAVWNVVWREGSSVYVSRAGREARPLDPAPPEMASAHHLFFESSGDLWAATSSGLHLFRAGAPAWEPRGGTGTLEIAVNDVVRTPDGQLWAATGSGVVVVEPEAAQTSGWPVTVKESVFTALTADGQGRVWASSGAGGVGLWRWAETGWDQVVDPTTRAPFHRMFMGADGDLWLAALGDRNSEVDSLGGAYRLDLQTSELVLPRASSGWPSAGADRIYAVAEQADGTLWLGGVAGLDRLGANPRHWEAPELATDEVYSLALDDDGRVWFAHRKAGTPIGWVEGDSVHYLSDHPESRRGDDPPIEGLWELEQGPDGSLWMANAGGVWRWKDGWLRRVGAGANLPELLSWGLLIEEGQAFVGTMGVEPNPPQGLWSYSLEESGHLDATEPAIRIEAPVLDDGRLVVRWDVRAFRGAVSAAAIFTRTSLGEESWGEWSQVRAEVLDLSSAEGAARVFRVQAKYAFGATATDSITVGRSP